MALLGPKTTVKVFAEVYGPVLAPTVQVIVLAVAEATGQSTPSMVTVAEAASRLVPVRVRVYPPLMSPYLGETEVTMGVLSCLNSIALVKV